MNLTAIDTGHNNRPLEVIRSPHSSDDYYNVIPTTHKEATPEPPKQFFAEVNKLRGPNPATINIPHQESTPQPSNKIFAAVNKPRRPNTGSKSNVSDSTEDNPYEIADDASAPTASQPADHAATGLYHSQQDDPETLQHLNTTDPYLAPGTLDTNTYTTAQHLYDVLTGARATTPTAQCLDQESHQSSMTSHAQDNEYNSLDLEEGEGPDHVYRGLNEGYGDNYNEVNRHRRREIPDDQRSHVQ